MTSHAYVTDVTFGIHVPLFHVYMFSIDSILSGFKLTFILVSLLSQLIAFTIQSLLHPLLSHNIVSTKLKDAKFSIINISTTNTSDFNYGAPHLTLSPRRLLNFEPIHILTMSSLSYNDVIVPLRHRFIMAKLAPFTFRDKQILCPNTSNPSSIHPHIFNPIFGFQSLHPSI